MFHRNHDYVVLSKTFLQSELLPSSSGVERVWRAYGGDLLLSPPKNLKWIRINGDVVSKLLMEQCGCVRRDAYRYLHPAMLLWDLTHRTSDDVEFKAVAVSGECVVGLAGDERQMPM